MATIDTTKEGKLSFVFGQLYRFSLKYLNLADANDELAWAQMIKESGLIYEASKGEVFEKLIEVLIRDYLQMKDLHARDENFSPINLESFKAMMLDYWGVMISVFDSLTVCQGFQKKLCDQVFDFYQNWRQIPYSWDLTLELIDFVKIERSKPAA